MYAIIFWLLFSNIVLQIGRDHISCFRKLLVNEKKDDNQVDPAFNKT